jgi:hypothetical protein
MKDTVIRADDASGAPKRATDERAYRPGGDRRGLPQ